MVFSVVVVVVVVVYINDDDENEDDDDALHIAINTTSNLLAVLTEE